MPDQFDVINPYNLNIFYSYNLTSKNEAISKLNHLKNSNYSVHEITKKFDHLVNLINENKNVISKTITQEIGKTIRDTKIELDRAEVTINAIRDARRSLSGDLLDSNNYLPGENKLGLVKYAPLGIILAMTPFNFPINLALHKIIPALAMGNSVLFKPHPQCYKSSEMLTELFYQAGFDKQDIQMICPSNEDMKTIITHAKVNCVSFTGGIQGARAISALAVMKKQLFELGGNDALVIYPNSDYKKAVSAIINQRFGCAGQRCTASKRIFIHQECYDEVKELLLTETKKITVGDPLSDDSFLGPVVHEKAAMEIEKRILDAKKLGARIIFGGDRSGAVISPTIIENTTEEMELIKEETFGPVVPLFSFSSTNELIDKINNSTFGLQCGVFTQDISLAKELFEKIDVGAIILNEGPGYRADHFPFGGNKMSGIGREGAKYALMEFSQPKTLIM